MNLQIRHPRLLVVEGRDEQLFFEAFLQYLRITEVQVLPIGGKTQLRPNLKALRNTPGFTNVELLGVIRDADDNAKGAWESVRDAVRDAGLAVPRRQSAPVGTSPQVTALILPGEDKRGALEDLCLRAVATDPAMACVEDFFQCLRRRPAPKASVQVFLASRSKPGLRLGEAAQAGYWPWNAPTFERLRRFLQLFGRYSS
jgi:hypothetical protein